jgi:predicted RNase H-like HicB family nuclease
MQEGSPKLVSYATYVKEAMRKATYEQMEDGSWFASIPDFVGLWASGPTIEETRDDLLGALEGWLVTNVFVSQIPVPVLNGVAFGLGAPLE